MAGLGALDDRRQQPAAPCQAEGGDHRVVIGAGAEIPEGPARLRRIGGPDAGQVQIEPVLAMQHRLGAVQQAGPAAPSAPSARPAGRYWSPVPVASNGRAERRPRSAARRSAPRGHRARAGASPTGVARPTSEVPVALGGDARSRRCAAPALDLVGEAAQRLRLSAPVRSSGCRAEPSAPVSNGSAPRLRRSAARRDRRRPP